MNTPRTLVVALFAGSALLGFASGAMADDDEFRIDATQLPVSQEQAVQIAQQAVPGTIAGTELDSEDELTLWEIEIIDGTGQEVDVQVDANTGEVVAQEIDDDRHEGEDHDDGDDDGDHEDRGDDAGPSDGNAESGNRQQ